MKGAISTSFPVAVARGSVVAPEAGLNGVGGPSALRNHSPHSALIPGASRAHTPPLIYPTKADSSPLSSSSESSSADFESLASDSIPPSRSSRLHQPLGPSSSQASASSNKRSAPLTRTRSRKLVSQPSVGGIAVVSKLCVFHQEVQLINSAEPRTKVDDS